MVGTCCATNARINSINASAKRRCSCTASSPSLSAGATMRNPHLRSNALSFMISGSASRNTHPSTACLIYHASVLLGVEHMLTCSVY
eukprot:1883100-Amphidinium_carterae.1